MSDVVLKHAKYIELSCRLCLKEAVRGGRSKHDYKDAFLAIWGEDITEDQNDRHPLKICKSCTKLFHRYYQNMKDENPFRTNKTLPNCLPHGENCQLCMLHEEVGSPDAKKGPKC